MVEDIVKEVNKLGYDFKEVSLHDRGLGLVMKKFDSSNGDLLHFFFKHKSVVSHRIEYISRNFRGGRMLFETKTVKLRDFKPFKQYIKTISYDIVSRVTPSGKSGALMAVYEEVLKTVYDESDIIPTLTSEFLNFMEEIKNNNP